jgi:hypothetical protein
VLVLGNDRTQVVVSAVRTASRVMRLHRRSFVALLVERNERMLHRVATCCTVLHHGATCRCVRSGGAVRRSTRVSTGRTTPSRGCSHSSPRRCWHSTSRRCL